MRLSDWWRAFGRWRRTRPFWGGLLILVGAAPILVVPLMAIQVVLGGGTGGVSGVLLGSILVVLGLSVWFTPVTRVIAGLIAVLVGLAAFPLVNLGGFFLGTFFAVLGGAMAASWGKPRPKRPADADPREPADTSPDAEPAPPALPADAEPAKSVRRKAFRTSILAGLLGVTALAAPTAQAAPASPTTATEITITAGAGWVGGLSYRGNETIAVTEASGRTRQVEVMHWSLDDFTAHSDLTLTATASNGVTFTLRQEAAPFTDNASFRSIGDDKVDLYLTRMTADLITFTPTCHPGAWKPFQCGPLPVIVPPPHLEYLLIGMTGHHLRIPYYEPGGRANPGRMTLSGPGGRGL